MASLILDLILNGLYDLTGNYMMVGLIILFVFAMLFAAIGIPFLAISVILAGFIWGIVQAGWLPLWAKGVLAIILGLAFFYNLYQAFKT